MMNGLHDIDGEGYLHYSKDNIKHTSRSLYGTFVSGPNGSCDDDNSIEQDEGKRCLIQKQNEREKCKNYEDNDNDRREYNFFDIARDNDMGNMDENELFDKIRKEIQNADLEYIFRFSKLQNKAKVILDLVATSGNGENKTDEEKLHLYGKDQEGNHLNENSQIKLEQLKNQIISCYHSLHMLRLFAAKTMENLHGNLMHAKDLSKDRNKRVSNNVSTGKRGISQENYNELHGLLHQTIIANYSRHDNELVDILRKYYADFFTSNDINLAEYEMLSLSEEEMKHERASYLEIIALVVFSVSFGLMMLIHFNGPLSNSVRSIFGPRFVFSSEFRIFRGTFLIMAWLWSLVVLLKVFIISRINFLFLLQLDEIDIYQAAKLKRIFSVFASIATIFWCFSALVYAYFSSSVILDDIPLGDTEDISSLPPFFLCLLTLSSILLVIWKLRRKIFKIESLWNVFGIHTTTFFAAFFTNYLTSSSILLGDISNMMCYLFAGDWQLRHGPDVCINSQLLQKVIVPIIYCFPLFVRLNQNIERIFIVREQKRKGRPNTNSMRFMINSFKYLLSITIVLMSSLKYDEIWLTKKQQAWSQQYVSFRVIFFSLLFLSSLISFMWDVYVDWGMFYERFDDENANDLEKKRRHCIRSKRMYSRWWLYPLAIVLDALFRLTWVLNIIFIGEGEYGIEYVIYLYSPLIAFAEVLRRTMWALLRMENEQVNNIIGYRDRLYVPLLIGVPNENDKSQRDREKKSEGSNHGSKHIGETKNLSSSITYISSVFDFSINGFAKQALMFCCIVCLFHFISLSVCLVLKFCLM